MIRDATHRTTETRSSRSVSEGVSYGINHWLIIFNNTNIYV